MKFYYPKNEKGEIIGFKTPESQVYDKLGRSLTDKMRDVENTKATKNDLNVQKARIDNLAAEPIVDGSELADIRTGADAVNYTTAGTAVREQFKKKVSFGLESEVLELKSPAERWIKEINDKGAETLESIPDNYSALSNRVGDLEIDSARNEALEYHLGNVNMLNPTAYKDNMTYSNGAETYTSGYRLYDYIPVRYGKTIYFSMDSQPVTVNYVYLFNEDKTLLNTLTNVNNCPIPPNVKYARVCMQGDSTTITKFKVEYDKVTAYTQFMTLAGASTVTQNLYDMIQDLYSEIENIKNAINV